MPMKSGEWYFFPYLSPVYGMAYAMLFIRGFEVFERERHKNHRVLLSLLNRDHIRLIYAIFERGPIRYRLLADILYISFSS